MSNNIPSKEAVQKLSIAKLVALYNEHADKPVKSFRDKNTAVKRVNDLLAPLRPSATTAGGKKPPAHAEAATADLQTVVVWASKAEPREGTTKAYMKEALEDGPATKGELVGIIMEEYERPGMGETTRSMALRRINRAIREGHLEVEE